MALRIRPCRPWQRRAFCSLLARYFREELQLPVTDDQAWELSRGILYEARRGVPLALAVQNGVPVGFIDYQVDWPGSSWCFHPGWGCVRECYVAPEARGAGIGRALADHALTWARRRGAKKMYLTADAAIPFWRHLGFCQSGRRNEKNGMEELERTL